MSSQVIIDSLFSEQNLPLLNKIKNDTFLTNFELLNKVRVLSQKKMEEVNQWILSLDMENID